MTTKTEYTVEQAYDDLVAGLEIGIHELTTRLNANIKSLSKAELERALSSIINYPEPVKVYHEREQNFIKNLLGLRGLQLQAEIQVLAEIQKQGDMQEGEQENG
jgi:hypothetical protein